MEVVVSKKTLGGVLAGTSLIFGGILYFTVKSLTTQSMQLGCLAAAPGCQQVATGLGISHIAVGFLSAIFSFGVYFLAFHKDVAEQIAIEERERRSQEERIELLGKVMTEGEKALLSAIVNEDGITQSTLAYRTNLTPGRVSQVLAEFEQQGLIQRKPAGRTYRVHATI